jgi:hypothetical protein
MKESLKILFLIVAYNFILEYISEKLPIKLFPDDLQSFVMLMSFDSALYLAWLFGYRYSTLLWFSYLFFFQILGLSLITQSFYPITHFTPSFLITLIFLSLSESPTEKHTKKILEEKYKLEKELEDTKEQVKLAQDLLNLLKREKEQVEIKLSQLEESQTIEKQRLLKEKEELIQRISQAQMHLNEYQSRLERLTEANRKLFEVIDLLQRQEEKNQKGEIAQLRRERKKLVKELLQLESTLEDCRRQNAQLKLELSEFESIKREREILAIELQDLKKKQKTKGDIYKEVLNFLLENIEMEDRAISEFIHLPIEKKREFVKELLILNMKERGESLENMKGLKNVFKLKPRGGRIYFTFGENRRWKVLGLIASEDDKDKEKYAKEILIKYMQ